MLTMMGRKGRVLMMMIRIGIMNNFAGCNDDHDDYDHVDARDGFHFEI